MHYPILLTSSLASLTAAANVASLGSSYAYGPGLQSGYPAIFASLLGATYHRFAVSGSTLQDVPGQAKQLSGTTWGAIAMTSGGNDLNYVGCMGDPTDSVCANTISHQEFVDRWQKALSAIYSNLPSSNQPPLYVVTYPRALGPATGCKSGNTNCPLDAADVTKYENMVSDIAHWTVDAVDTFKNSTGYKQQKITIIPMWHNSDGHENGSKEPWVNAHNAAANDGAAWHPNKSGAQWMGQKVHDTHTAQEGASTDGKE